MLLGQVAPDMALTATFRTLIRRAFDALAMLLAARRRDDFPRRIDAHVLKDVGLSQSDYPAMRSGLLFQDETRRQR